MTPNNTKQNAYKRKTHNIQQVIKIQKMAFYAFMLFAYKTLSGLY